MGHVVIKPDDDWGTVLPPDYSARVRALEMSVELEKHFITMEAPAEARFHVIGRALDYLAFLTARPSPE